MGRGKEYHETVVESEEDEAEENTVEGDDGESLQRRRRALQRISLNVADGLLSSDVGAGQRVRVIEEVGGPANSFSRTQETQTPPESGSKNRIAALIAQRRDVIVRKAEKEERENEKHLDERIKRAARLLRGKEEEEEVEMEESSDEDNQPSVNEKDVSQEDGDDDNDVERQEVDKLLGDLCESRSKSSS